MIPAAHGAACGGCGMGMHEDLDCSYVRYQVPCASSASGSLLCPASHSGALPSVCYKLEKGKLRFCFSRLKFMKKS